MCIANYGYKSVEKINKLSKILFVLLLIDQPYEIKHFWLGDTGI